MARWLGTWDDARIRPQQDARLRGNPFYDHALRIRIGEQHICAITDSMPFRRSIIPGGVGIRTQKIPDCKVELPPFAFVGDDRNIAGLRDVALPQGPSAGHAGFAETFVAEPLQPLDHLGNPARLDYSDHQIDDGLGIQARHRGAADMLDLRNEIPGQRAPQPCRLLLEPARPRRIGRANRDALIQHRTRRLLTAFAKQHEGFMRGGIQALSRLEAAKPDAMIETLAELPDVISRLARGTRH